jgi:hypothetical protein
MKEELLDIDSRLVKKIDYAEALIKVGDYKEGRKHALDAAEQTENKMEEIIGGFLILLSYLLEGNTAKANLFLSEFIQKYGQTDLRIEERKWPFNGLVNFINNTHALLEKKFILFTIIDTLQGKIDKQKLSIFSMV